MELGERIRYLREAKSWKQSDLAEKLGVGIATVSGWEIGTRTPRIDTINQIASVLGVTASWLLGDDSSMDLESSFPEGMMLLRRASNELDDEQKHRLSKMIEMMIESMKNRS